jgi:hypothetical protein
VSTRTALALALALLVAGCGGGSSTLSKHALAQRAGAVQSLAAEGALLADDAAAGRSTSIFVREHSSELAIAASTARTTLEGGRTAPALEPELQRLRRIAGRVATGLDRLAGASRSETRSIAHQLQTAADQSKTLGDALG